MKSIDEVKSAFNIADSQIEDSKNYNNTISEKVNSEKFIFNDLDFEKLNKDSIEYMLQNSKFSEKEYVNLFAFASTYSRVPIESLNAAKTDKGYSLLNALLIRGAKQPIKPDILNTMIEQCNYRITNLKEKFPDKILEIKSAMAEVISSALENKIDIKVDDIKKAYDSGLITYENLREMGEKGILTKEILEMPISNEIMHFNFTDGRREMKESIMPLHQFLLHDNISVQKGDKSVSIVDYLEKTFPNSQLPFQDILLSYELEKQAYQTFAEHSVISDFSLLDNDNPLKYQQYEYKELISAVNKNNYEAIGRVVSAMVSGRKPSSQTADIICDLLAKYNKYNKDPKTKELANYIDHIHQQCLTALNTGKEITKEQQEQANATVEKALKFVAKNKLTTKIAIEELSKPPKAPKTKKGKFFVSAPQGSKDDFDAELAKSGIATVSKNEMLIALLKLPCNEADQYFDKLQYLVPEQKQFEGNVVAKLFYYIAELFCLSSVKSKYAQRLKEHMDTPEEIVVEAEQAEVKVEVAPEVKAVENPQLQHLKKPTGPAPRPLIPGTKSQKSMTLKDAAEISASTVNPEFKNILQTQVEGLAKTADIGMKGKGGGIGM